MDRSKLSEADGRAALIGGMEITEAMSSPGLDLSGHVLVYSGHIGELPDVGPADELVRIKSRSLSSRQIRTAVSKTRTGGLIYHKV